MKTIIPAAVIALVCSTTPLLAQTRPPAPVQSPAPTQMPGDPAAAVPPGGAQTPSVQTPGVPMPVQTPTVQSPAVATPTVQPSAATPTQTPTGVAPTGSPQTPATGSTMPTTSATPQPSPVTDTDHGTAIVLLDRIQKLLDAAVAKGGPITLERGLVDEMRAEVTQVKLSLQGEKP